MTSKMAVTKEECSVLKEQYIEALRKFKLPVDGRTELLPLNVVLSKVLHTIDGYTENTHIWSTTHVTRLVEKYDMDAWFSKLYNSKVTDKCEYYAEVQSILIRLSDVLKNEPLEIRKARYNTYNYYIEVSD